MASIDPQIDAAVMLMKERAAQFDETREMKGPGCSAMELASRAENNAARATNRLLFRQQRALAVTDLIDTMNLCALALSLLSAHAAGEQENHPPTGGDSATGDGA